jgi:hypothetical protein
VLIVIPDTKIDSEGTEEEFVGAYCSITMISRKETAQIRTVLLGFLLVALQERAPKLKDKNIPQNI